VGLGTEHQRLTEEGDDLYGIDLIERAGEYTNLRLRLFSLSSRLSVGDSERLVFPDQSFDLLYSWGVLHHSPDTPKAIAEVFRVLKRRGGRAKVMIYQTCSMSGAMLWLLYALLAGRLLCSLRRI
jgi:ubiquinone/menaquinone biosynthesis C-methylase UbiE